MFLGIINSDEARLASPPIIETLWYISNGRDFYCKFCYWMIVSNDLKRLKESPGACGLKAG